MATLLGVISQKSGPSSNRAWSITISTSDDLPVTAVQIDTVVLTPTSGGSGLPVLRTSLPLAIGDIPAAGFLPDGSPIGRTVTGNLMFDFSRCPVAERYSATIGFSGNAGGTTGNLVKLNQYE
jgi:hypothetical protein